MGKTFSRRRVAIELAVLSAVVVGGVFVERSAPPIFMTLLIRAAITLGAVATTLFWCYYLRSQWRASALGRTLMATQVTTSATLWWTLFASVTPQFPGKRTGWLVIFALASYSFLRLFLSLRRSQIRQTRRLRRDRLASQETVA